MKPTCSSNKQIQRKENKMRKLSALCMISSLNDDDRKKSIQMAVEEKQISNSGEGHESEKYSSIPKFKKRKFDEFHDESVKGNPDIVRKPLSDDEHQKLRILIKQRFAAKKNLPKLNLKEPGIQASTNHPCGKRVPLFLSDIQHFILHSLHGHMSTGNIPRWVSVEKFNHIHKVLFLVVEGMSLTDYHKFENLCPTLKEFPQKLEVISPLAYGGCLIREIATVPLTESQRHKLEKKFSMEKSCTKQVLTVFRTMFPTRYSKSSNIDEINKKNKQKYKFSRTELLLAPWQMIEELYPLPIRELKEKYADYVFSKDYYKEVTPSSPMWALDCEMCLTCAGSEVTRISVVNEDLEVMYESFVKPHNDIIDYVTRFSGITPKHLANVTTRLEDVQAELRKIMPPDLILIGHSLNGDLHALKLLHPYCIDTSVIFNLSGERARKTKLKVLSAEILGERIQEGTSGHDSIEDAAACMKLVHKKLQNSIEWGDAVISGRQSVEQILINSSALLHENDLKRKEAMNGTVKKNKSLNSTNNYINHIVEAPIAKRRNTIPKHIHGEEIGQVQMLTTSLFSHLISRNKKCLLVAKQSDISEYTNYIPDNLFPFHPESRMQISEQVTNKAIVKFGRNNAPESGATIMYTVVEREPEVTASKVDHLVKKLTKGLSGNVLFGVFLAGRTTAFDEVDTTNNGLLFIKLQQETIPSIKLDSDVYKSSSVDQPDK